MQKLAKLEMTFQDSPEVMEIVKHVPINANDDYQYAGILYDLGITLASRKDSPFFLVNIRAISSEPSQMNEN